MLSKEGYKEFGVSQWSFYAAKRKYIQVIS